MTYARGDNSSVSGQPPQRVRQYATPALTNVVRTRSASVGYSGITFGCSERIDRSRVARGHSANARLCLLMTLRTFFDETGASIQNPPSFSYLEGMAPSQTAALAKSSLTLASSARPLSRMTDRSMVEMCLAICSALAKASNKSFGSFPSTAIERQRDTASSGELAGGSTALDTVFLHASPGEEIVSGAIHRPIKNYFVHQDELLVRHAGVADHSPTRRKLFRTRHAVRIGAAVGPAGLGCPPTLRTCRAASHRRNRPLSGTALCGKITRLQPQQGCGQIWRLSPGLDVAASCGLGKPVSHSPVHHLPCREIHGDDLGHVFVSKSLSGREASQ